MNPRRNPRLNLCLAICTRDDAAALVPLLAEARNSRLFDEILLVDDASDPPIAEKISLRGLRLIRHDLPRGIGAARNAAITATRCTHLMFIDSDDKLLPELRALLADLARAGPFDLCLFRHIDSSSATGGQPGQSAPDEGLWQAAGHTVGSLRPAESAALPLLARSTNYPWNKIYNVDFLRRAQIRCPETAVHEDMALHWLSLARALRVLVSDRACIWHQIGAGPGESPRLTQRRDGVRLQLFPAMQMVAEGLRGAAWRAAFLDYALTLTDWAEGRIHPGLRPRFQHSAHDWFSQTLAEWEKSSGPKPAGEKPDGEKTAWGNATPFEADARLTARLSSPPAVIGQARIRIALCGPHAMRSPFGYASLRPLWQDHIELVAEPEAADLVICTHPQDARQLPEGDSGTTLALFSEEPFWDSLFSPDPLAETVLIAGRALHQVNHHRSPIFAFDRLPYFLLTDHRFAAAYGHRFARNARLAAGDWQAAFAARKWRAAFMAERRIESFHDLAFPEGGILGLCAWRSRLAASMPGAMPLGPSWQGGVARLDLPDWHMDKLMRLDGRALMISAIENTHQPAYVSEKIFDAFACGGVPLYVAEDSHSLHRLDLPPEAWINLHGLDSGEAALRLKGWMPSPGMAMDYAAAQSRLAALFGDIRIWQAERQRLSRSLLAEVERLVQSGPARTLGAAAAPAKADPSPRRGRRKPQPLPEPHLG